MTNHQLAEVLFQLQTATRSINPSFSKALERATESILAEQSNVCTMERSALMKLKGFNGNNVGLIERLMRGECIESVFDAVPPAVRPTPKAGTGNSRGMSGALNLYNEFRSIMKGK